MAPPLADAGLVTVGVTSLVDARTFRAGTGLAAVGVADLADDGVLLRTAPVVVVNSPENSSGIVCWGDRTSPDVWSHTRTIRHNILIVCAVIR